MGADNVFTNVADGAKDIVAAADTATSALERLMKSGTGAALAIDSMGGSSAVFKDLRTSIESSAAALNTITEKAGSIAIAIGGNGLAKELVSMGGYLKDIAGGFGSVTIKAVALFGEVMDAVDAPSKALRDMDRQAFELGKSFSSSRSDTDKFATALLAVPSSKFAEGMFLSGKELNSFLDSAARTNLNLDQLSQTIDTGMGFTNLYTAATAAASATGLGYAKVADLMNKAINEQGMSAQAAYESLGTFSSVSEKTGLSVDDVADSLNSSVNSFQKLGVTADFGRPVLEAFGKTVKDLGLGIEQSIGLTTSLTSALAGLTTNYTNAYLVFQRGGLNIGGGGQNGVLGASIGLQNATMEAEKTGDQGKIASQLMAGLKDTLTSFTHGDIVTVKAANESPELQTQFYTQQQLLKTQFGVSDDMTATRILDLLSSLDEATASGNDDAKQSITKRIQEEMGSRSATLDSSEKLQRTMESQIQLISSNHRDELTEFRSTNKYLESIANTVIKDGATTLDKAIGKIPKQAKKDAERNMREAAEFSMPDFVDELNKASTPNRKPDPVPPNPQAAVEEQEKGSADIASAIKQALGTMVIKLDLQLSEDAKKMIAVTKGVTVSIDNAAGNVGSPQQRQ